ncbi:hypothetical protein ACFPOB_27330 [Bosea eneae]|uniref:Uncharacterized protein n=1 Tax=Bosea eneae TaxID=151454 RepID=A0ABW0J018_9HYPH
MTLKDTTAGGVEAVIDQASRLMAAGWRGNPNMSGDDRDFMPPSMRRKHDDKVRTVVEYVIAALAASPAPAPAAGVDIRYDDALNEAGWRLNELLGAYGPVSGRQFNNLKPILKDVIERYLADAHSKSDPHPEPDKKG